MLKVLVVAFASNVGVEMGEQGEVSKARPRILGGLKSICEGCVEIKTRGTSEVLVHCSLLGRRSENGGNGILLKPDVHSGIFRSST